MTAAAQAAASKLAADTVILDVEKVLGITDAFVVTSGTNRRQVLTIAEEVETQVKAAGGPAPLRTEGRTDAQWVLLDYGDFVVHVFLDAEVTAHREIHERRGDVAHIGRRVHQRPSFSRRQSGGRVVLDRDRPAARIPAAAPPRHSIPATLVGASV